MPVLTATLRRMLVLIPLHCRKHSVNNQRSSRNWKKNILNKKWKNVELQHSRRNSSDIDNETYNARNRGMKFKRVRAPSPDGDIVGSSDTSDETISNSTSTSENNLKDLRVKINQPYHIPQNSIHSYDNSQS